ncbi:MAG: DEAD/DEAH box helicase, partial [Ottowia sp.]|nr:DEAD/DEAH box helicase [Ottowia sp.]
SFFTASGKKPFARRVIVTTTDDWGTHAKDALKNQQPPVTLIGLADLEASVVDWPRLQPGQATVPLKKKKVPRAHQQHALADVLHGFRTHPRGKLLMACGTGKTFTSLKIAEDIAGAGGRVLFLVPSLALLQQTLTEWTQETSIPMHAYAVCSDSDVGKKGKKKAADDDAPQLLAHELSYPATTDAASLARNFRCDRQHTSVIFATYQSIAVISQAQQHHGLPDLDLIICDEAHRTTGATFGGEEESAFIRVHDGDFIRAAKRLYMTATPRIYGDDAKAREKAGAVTLCSMDDEALYGPIFHTISFSQAVEQDLLCDYKVIVLAVDERHISHRLQQLLSSSEGLRVDDAAKIIGCWKALAKQGANGAGLTESSGAATDTDPMRRAVAFCQVIGTESGAAGRGNTHKVSSKHIAHIFQRVVEAYQQSEIEAGTPAATLRCAAQHVDGSMSAGEKEAHLQWLRDEPAAGECRILSNVRCLSEGVDVPALDAVLFLTPRNSQIDVVQSVGRVMRLAPGKKYGYVVLPIVIPSAQDPETALASNEPYRVVWQVLQALRSHDDKFDALVNRLEFDGADPGKMEVIAITGDVRQRAQPLETGAARGEFGIGKAEAPQPAHAEPQQGEQLAFTFEPGEIERAIYARLVRKVGRSTYWEDWARDIETIARAHITRIEGILANPANTKERATFAGLVQEMREDINSSVTEGEVVEMLAQHIITRPIFDALFSGYHFSRLNPMSRALQDVLDVLQEHHLDSEAQTLQGFYENIQRSIQDTRTTAGKQEIIRKLYDRFFRNAFPRMAERLGIVYTPVQVVDFILHSVAHLLQKEFGRTIGDKDVRILDPFTGTGTFIARLIQSDLIADAELKTKYLSGLYANEIVLLAYYI